MSGQKEKNKNKKTEIQKEEKDKKDKKKDKKNTTIFNCLRVPTSLNVLVFCRTSLNQYNTQDSNERP